jgi:hypothetical protein
MTTQSKTFRNWKATRSGTGLVVHGTDIDTNEASKITGIVMIEPPLDISLREVMATAADGTRHRLIYP